MKAYNFNDFAVLIAIYWAMSLKQRYPNQQIAVACELKKVLLFMP
jgi:hypothetical protein